VITPAGAGGEDAVVTHEVEARRWDGEGEPLEEGARIEDDLRRAVSPASLEAVGKAAVGQPRKPLGGERRTGDVPAEAFEVLTILGGDRHTGVEAEAGFACAARLGPWVASAKRVGQGPVAQAEEALACSWARGDAALEGSNGQACKQWLVAGAGIGHVTVRFGPKATYLHQARDLAGRGGEHLGHLGGTRGREGMEAGRSAPRDFVNAVQCQRVEVGVQVRGGGPKALDEGDGTALDSPLLAGTAAQRCEEGPQEEIQDLVTLWARGPARSFEMGSRRRPLFREAREPASTGPVGEKLPSSR